MLPQTVRRAKQVELLEDHPDVRADSQGCRSRSELTTRPSTVTVPEVGRSSALTSLSNVDFPAPRTGNFRFSAKGLASQRQRLGLSAEQCGLLLGASSQSVYNWEQGKTRPLARHLPAIAAVRGMSKKDAAARLQSLQR